MDKIVYLYGLTLSNYIDKDDVLEEYPIYETTLIEFIKKNKIILNSKELIHTFIIYLHYELDCLFYRSPKKDIICEANALDKSRLRSETKKLASNIKKLFLNLTKKNN